MKKIINQVNRKAKFIAEPIKAKSNSPYVKKTMKYADMYKSNKVHDNYILYQSRDGKSMTDSPYATFLYLLNNKKFSNLKHIWIVDSKSKKEEYSHNYKDFKNVKFVIKESDEYLEYLTTSKYILNNSTFPAYFTKKEAQIYINTWHGTPLKHMGLDVEDNLLGSQNIIKNFLSSDIIVSPNKHTSEVFKRAFKLEGLYEGNIMEIGYPRIDLTLNAERDKVLSRLKEYDVSIGDRKILLFAPTWRGQDVNKPEDSIEEIYHMIMELKNSTNYQVLVKVHPFAYKIALKYKQLRPFLIPDSFDTNELLSVVDLLVTDYSSIFFDYLVTNKPIIFYSQDYEEYETDRGFYIMPEDLPGPSVYDLQSLLDTVQNIDSIKTKYDNNYKYFQQEYVPHENGKVTEILVDEMFKKVSTKNQSEKEKILIYPGGMRNNGITTSAINLLENIDYDKYDVTIFIGNTSNPEVLKNLDQVNENVRIILRKGPLLATTSEKYRDAFIKNRGLESIINKILYPELAYKREFRKIFGNSKFDYVVDFSGYSMFWPKILLGTNSKKKIIYLHSDINSDMNRTVNGKKPHYINLKGVISLYHKFDYLVSVSEETNKINFRNLSTPSTCNKFTSSMNTINLNRINTLVENDSDILDLGKKKYLLVNRDNEIDRIPFNTDDYKVMAMGRLSPEKGFDILINAFKGIVESNNKAKLFILGDGPLKQPLENLIKKLDLENNVYLVGQKSNPFYIMKQCDLFVLSSHYEGQSMVLLEALTLKTSILASDIPANRYVLKYGDYGMLSENTPDSIEQGIHRYMNRNTPDYETFNEEEYNSRAINEFYNLIR
ncbi:glycosyltransferase [Mammaliicoccus sciuri]|uniref:glycosyltransferase n=1 Tax=Mammaliicoccus sciuri TaxID=1296 RepID=UPI001E414304|nr:glycosyltransferase [Mammaliicoccus sciuri]MCD8795099.1 CDP-glycerol glycerophosphotransferase family protein [Mammaliicoccus sciuri]